MKKMKLGKKERITLEVVCYDLDSYHKILSKETFYFTEIAKYHVTEIDNKKVVLRIVNQINDK